VVALAGKYCSRLIEKKKSSLGPRDRLREGRVERDRPLWPPQRGVGLQEPNLGKTNLCVSLVYSLAICFAPSLADSFLYY
jgi:hypothetical protein